MGRLLKYIKTALIAIGTIALGAIIFLFGRKYNSNDGGIQSDTRSPDDIRDGIESSKAGITESTGHIEQSIVHTGNGISAIQRAREILNRAKQRSTEGNKDQ